MTGFDKADGGTSGGIASASGVAVRRIHRAGIAILVAGMLLQAIANVYSRLADMRVDHISVPSWEVWTWELTSFVALLILLPVAWRLARLHPPRLGWLGTAAVHLAGSIASCLVHVGLMVTLRRLAYTAHGTTYSPDGSWQAILLYEYRKDAIGYAIIVGALGLTQHLAARRNSPAFAPAPASAPPLLVIQDGSRRSHIRLDEIEAVRAAGNYVEVALADRTLLHRQTLAATETALGPADFARIHRSALVRRAAIREIATNDSGDFVVTLQSGNTIRGSRRFRDQLLI